MTLTNLSIGTTGRLLETSISSRVETKMKLPASKFFANATQAWTLINLRRGLLCFSHHESDTEKKSWYSHDIQLLFPMMVPFSNQSLPSLEIVISDDSMSAGIRWSVRGPKDIRKPLVDRIFVDEEILSMIEKGHRFYRSLTGQNISWC